MNVFQRRSRPPLRQRAVGALAVAATLSVVALVTPAPGASAAPGTQPGTHGFARQHGVPRIAFGRLDPQIGGFALWTANPNGSRQRRITRGQAYFPSWSPDRSQLLFDFPDSRGNEQIATVNADGTGLRQLTHAPGISEVAKYAVHGSKIVFDRSPTFPDDPSFSVRIWIMDANGHHARPMTAPAPGMFDVEPDVAPDGYRIAFTRAKSDGDAVVAAIFVTTVNGSHERRLTPYAEGLEHPQWSPDGRAVLYDILNESDFSDPSNGIWRVGLDRHRRMVAATTAKIRFFKPDYAPDGRRILTGCRVVVQGQDDLCVLLSNGRGLRNITRTTGPDSHENFPIWQ